MLSSVLPDDILVDILLRLQGQSLSRLRCVCKRFRNFINDPSFLKMHRNNAVENDTLRRLILIRGHKQIFRSVHYYDPSSLTTCYNLIVEINHPRKFPRICGSCNGLFLLATQHPTTYGRDSLTLWNPCTSEYKEIPDPPWYKGKLQFYDDLDPRVNTSKNLAHSFDETAYGFGYDCKIDDYKIVKIISLDAYVNSNSYEKIFVGCEVVVYTLGTNSWKQLMLVFPYYVVPDNGVLVNGVLHWTGTKESGGNRWSDVIVSFDFVHERLVDVLPVVEHFDRELMSSRTLGNMGGCLCLFGRRSSWNWFEVWVMKEYGVRESWTKLFTIAQQSLGTYYSTILKPIHFFKTGEILLKHDNVGRHALGLYDPKHERVTTLKIHGGECGDWSGAHTFVDSLVSLNTGTYLAQRTRLQEAKQETKKRKRNIKMKKKDDEPKSKPKIKTGG